MDMYDRIRNRRKELGMTQDELARLTGYNDRSSIAKIEAKKADLSQSKIIAFAEALKVSTSYLMDGDNKDKINKKEEKDEVKTAARDKKVFDKYSKLDEAKRKIVEALINSYFDENVEDEED